MNKQLVALGLVSFFLSAENNSKIFSVLENCQTIIATMNNEDMEAIQKLLENYKMREAILIALYAKGKQ